MPKLPPYVSMARFDWWQVKGAGPLASDLRALGFRRALLPLGEMNAHFKPPLDFEGSAALAARLRDLGLAFSHGRDWAPSEVLLDLRDRGLLDGPFTNISWRGPGDWLTREV